MAEPEMFDMSGDGYVEAWAVVAARYRGWFKAKDKSLFNGKPVYYHRVTFQMYCAGPNGEKMSRAHSLSFNTLTPSGETKEFLAAIGASNIPFKVRDVSAVIGRLDSWLRRVRPHISFTYEERGKAGKNGKKHKAMVSIKRYLGTVDVPESWSGFTKETEEWMSKHSQKGVKHVQEDGKAAVSEEAGPLQEDIGGGDRLGTVEDFGTGGSGGEDDVDMVEGVGAQGGEE